MNYQSVEKLANVISKVVTLTESFCLLFSSVVEFKDVLWDNTWTCVLARILNLLQ